jgi:hypothetical protein
METVIQLVTYFAIRADADKVTGRTRWACRGHD